ncbi:cytosolic carboxypeptidase 3 isoform X2 [Mirounga angustirostris]|uniref:cytosolic carboxypeptidase 3 isoform X2 n=1 Tax=Mirounga angustirostris TaxID=9716 RepID=UPI0023E410C6|nr:cytosolic carboxypeptidase 3 isoform X1 [Mirounga angustirostris]
MSEDSEKEDYSDRTISDDESDEDNFMKFVSEDIHRCALLTADSISDPFFPRTTQILLEYQLGRWVPRLREPRDLYGVSSSGPLSPTRWPYHCEVIDEKVQHIDWTPSYPEPLYTPTGLEMEPLYPNSKEDTVVYLAEDGNKRGTHFNTQDLESVGYHFCDSLLDYCDPDRTKYYQCLKELEEMEKHINLEKILEDSDTSLKEMTLDLESSSRGSDSSESNESQTYLLKLTSQIKSKKKHLKTKKERNSTIASHQNTREEQEACDKGHLVRRHRESNSDVKDIKPNVSDDCIFDYFRRPFPNQGLDLHHNLKSKMKECTSFQSKKTGINWTDDEKRIYRDKKIAQTQEILQYLLPIMESTKNAQTPQIKQILNPRTNCQIQHQLMPATYINIQRCSTSWTPPRNHPFISQRNLMVSSPEWLQSVSQRSLESLSALKVPKKKKKHSRIKATKTKDMKPLSSKWETIPSSFEKDADIIKEKSLQAEESNEQNSMQIAPRPIKNRNEQPSKNHGQATFYLKFQRDK